MEKKYCPDCKKELRPVWKGDSKDNPIIGYVCQMCFYRQGFEDEQ